MKSAPSLVRETAGHLPRPGVPQYAPQPRKEWVVGTCPLCGSPVVRNSYYVGGKGYLLVEECWEALSFPARCTHRQLL